LPDYTFSHWEFNDSEGPSPYIDLSTSENRNLILTLGIGPYSLTAFFNSTPGTTPPIPAAPVEGITTGTVYATYN
jgi:hypothetical protein